MKIIGIIPARWDSSRLAGKILADIAGKPMIQHVWERSKKSQVLEDVLIACDDEKVLKVAQNFGAKAILTSKDHASGTDRIVEVVKDLDVDIVVNIQGDEPLIQASVIDDLANALSQDNDAVMATVIKRLTDQKEIENSNVVKVVIDKNKNALYFSRSAVPFNREQKEAVYYKHLGIYAYRKDFLLQFNQLPKSDLEEAEQLEQLRVLDAGYKIKTVVTDIETIGVDTVEDLARVQSILNLG